MQLIEATNMKNAFVSLFNIYAHELSKYNPSLGMHINQDGNYLSEHVEQMLTDNSVEAFCITKGDRPIGIVVFSYTDEGKNECSIEQFFLIETSRRKGIAEKICRSFWEKNRGICILHVLKANLPAITYWEKLISKCGYTYKKENYSEQMLSYEISLN